MLVRGLTAAAAVVIIDQLSKAAVLGFFAGSHLGAHEAITPFFNLTVKENRKTEGRGNNFGCLFGSQHGAGDQNIGSNFAGSG